MTATVLKGEASASASNELAGVIEPKLDRPARGHRSATSVQAQAANAVATHKALKRTAYLLQKSNSVIRLTSSLTSPLLR